jgi:formamidopyrimidine-DNA glycosylase
MSGSLTRASQDRPPAAHDHVRFALDDATELRYNDPRRFGQVFALDDARLPSHPAFRGLGVEPLAPDLTPEWLRFATRGRRRPVKNLLLDQGFVVGLGNIYATEALFRARIHPRRPAGRISLEAWRRLVVAIREVLIEAIESGGTTLRDYRDAGGRPGRFAGRLEAYGRDGQPCPRCGRPIRVLVLAGRSTCYCPGCQR